MNNTEYLLTCLIEECAEVQKEATKALRFGLDDSWNGKKTQRELIMYELIDVFTVADMLINLGILDSNIDYEAMILTKQQRILKYMDYARERGTLKSEKEETQND